jgi:hypothetical protein
MASGGWHETVREHHKRTAGFVLAQSEPCVSTRDLEASNYVYGREFQALASSDLDELELPESWFMGVLVCPGDDLTVLAKWVADLDEEDLSRIRLYLHEDLDIVDVLEPWYGEGLPSPKTEPLLRSRRISAGNPLRSPATNRGRIESPNAMVTARPR